MIAWNADIALIGAGPIGIELAIALQAAGLDYVHLDGGQVGQTIYQFPFQTRFFSSNERISLAGAPLQTPDQSKATREQYLAYLRSLVLQHNLPIRTFEPLVDIKGDEQGFVLTTAPAAGRRIGRAQRVILCTGGTASPRKLNVPGEDLPHVSHQLHDPHRYFRRRVLIVGGRNSAVEAALRCREIGASVSLSYRRGQIDAGDIKYWLAPEILGMLESGRLAGFFNTTVKEILPDRVILQNAADGKIINVPADDVLLMIGYDADHTLLRLAGVPLTGDARQAPVFDPDTMQTPVQGLYVAGTAVGGTQEKYRVFIENCHVHVRRVVNHLLGKAPPPQPQMQMRPES